MAQTMTRKMTPSPTEGPTRTLTMLERLRAVRRVTVQENQRALVLKDGRFLDLLGPGRHEVSLRTDAGRFGELAEIAVHLHDLSRPEFVSPYETALFRERPDLVAAHLTEIRTSSDEVGVILRDGRIWAVQKPDGRSVVWTDAGPWTVERVDVSDDLAVERKLLRRLERFGPIDKVKRFTVDAEQAGLLFLDGAFARRLEPGAHAFWDVGRKVEVNRVDLRRHALDVTGQEILTKDRVSIRVNLAAEYRVADPEQAVSATTNYVDALYRALQYAFRKSLGAKTLDEILEQKVSVDAEVADKLRREMA
ncbi:MAG: SPFH domain-containing protein, partial [Pseudomonadota bacterium]